MIEIKKIYKKDIPALVSNEAFWKHSFLSISRHRLFAHYKNPKLEEDDIVLLLSYLNGELLGYMGLFTDVINIGGRQQKIGWLSTWWVHPKTKGSGIGREILNSMYAETHGRIGISQFTPSAKRVYDKSGYFVTLKENEGIKAVLRSNLTFVIPALFPKLKNWSGVLNTMDRLLNLLVNCKLYFQKVLLYKKLQAISVEYLNSIDDATREVINRYSTKDLSTKDDAFFEWLKAYNWVQKAPLLPLTDHKKYEFSMYDHEFEYALLKIKQQQKCIGFVVLQKRNYVAKVLFTYFDADKADVIGNTIKLQAITQNTREIICYDPAICDNFKKSKVFLYRTKKLKQSIISKVYGTTDFETTRMNFGDGDCSFA